VQPSSPRGNYAVHLVLSSGTLPAGLTLNRLQAQSSYTYRCSQRHSAHLHCERFQQSVQSASIYLGLTIGSTASNTLTITTQRCQVDSWALHIAQHWWPQEELRLHVVHLQRGLPTGLTLNAATGASQGRRSGRPTPLRSPQCQRFQVFRCRRIGELALTISSPPAFPFRFHRKTRE